MWNADRAAANLVLRMKSALTFAALAESGTGLALLLVPSVVGRVLLGVDLSGTAELLARFLGIALIGLGLACWPGPPRLGMLFYGGAATVFLTYVGLVERLVGILLWPAVILHLMLVASLVWASTLKADSAPAARNNEESVL